MTRTFFTTHTGREARTATRDYRCVYCRKYFISIADLLMHEHTCSLRALRLQDWAHQIERFKLHAGVV